MAVMFGVLCAAAVLTGALLVGDSMRGSLKALTLDRLGDIDTILFAPHFIEYNKRRNGTQRNDGISSEGVILLPAAVEFNGRISGVQLLGCALQGEAANVVANQALADAVGLQAGDTLSIRMMSPQSIPPESSLGRKDQLLRTRIRVDEIVPDTGIGRFSLKMDQQAEPLLIVPLEWLQARLDVGDKVNAVFFRTDTPPTFEPTLEDLGIDVEEHEGKWYIRSARMLFNDVQAAAIREFLTTECTEDARSHVGLLYLATSLRALRETSVPSVLESTTENTENARRTQRETPYSTIYACESLELVPNEIALNQWTADDLEVQISDEIELTWFDPHDTAITHTKTFTLTEILPMEGIGGDPRLVPEVRGFTDEASIADWEPPFPFDSKKIRKIDEDYWDKYKAAPKAFVSLETGQELWGSRFGKVTTFVVDHPALSGTPPKEGNNVFATQHPHNSPPVEGGHFAQQNGGVVSFGEKFHLDPVTFGITFVPVKEQGLAASTGTTPFSVLFLAFSFFIIASALMLVMMLFRLSVEMKAKRIGIQLAVGLSSGFVTKTLLIEGLLLSLLGSIIGTFFGIFYAWLMVYGLTTWWGDAVGISVGCQSVTAVPFLMLHINPVSLVIGFSSGVGLAMLTIVWSVRGVTKVPLRALLHGVVKGSQSTAGRLVGDSRLEHSPPVEGWHFAQQNDGVVTHTKETTPPYRAPLQRRGIMVRSTAPVARRSTDYLLLSPKNTAQRRPRTGWKKYEMVIAHCVFFSSLFLLLYGLIGSGLALSFSPSHFVLFFVTGTFVLLYGLVLYSLVHYPPRLTESASIASPLSFAQSSIARNPNRSVLCVALVASTTFLVLSISAFHLDARNESRGLQRGNGGYYFMGETMFPVFHDIGTPEGRAQLGIQPDDEKHIQERRLGKDNASLVSIRVKSGDDSSCLNLFQSGNPRILGLPRTMLENSWRFCFAQYPERDGNDRSYWSPLLRPVTIDPDGVRRVPVIIDANTAMYALHLYGGVGVVYEYDDSPSGIIRFEIVGLLQNSILQGEILMSEENLLALFPEVNGYQFFLFSEDVLSHYRSSDRAKSQIHPLDDRTLRIIYDLLGDYGFQGESTSDRLRKLFAVQNTYLSTFQSLGGIGLLLGIFGLAVIQSRNVLERRKELSLLMAVGFTKFRVILLLLYESFTLLVWGLGLAVIASAFALLPFLIGGVEQISPMSVLRQFVVLVGGLLAVGIVSNVAAALTVLRIPVARELAEER